MSKKKINKTRSITKDSGIKSAREKMIGQHIGYRYDVNLLPDYKKLTPFLLLNFCPSCQSHSFVERIGQK